jgi:hypothetical protein
MRLIAAAIITLVCLSANYATDAGTLRVMTFNIRYDEPRDNANAWPNRKEMAASMIRFHNADPCL